MSLHIGLAADQAENRTRATKQKLQEALLNGKLAIGDVREYVARAMEADGHATYIRNVAFALRERLAYSTLLEPRSTRIEHISNTPASHSRSSRHDQQEQQSGQAGPKGGSEAARVHPGFPAVGQAMPPIDVQALQFTNTATEEAWAPHAELAKAHEHIQALIVTRVKELQLLTEWPLVRAGRSPAVVARLQAEAEDAGAEGELWQALGMPNSPFEVLPELPDLIRRDLYGPLDLLLALAGHLARQEVADGAHVGQDSSKPGAGTSPDDRAPSNQVHNVHPSSTGSGNTAGYNRTASQRGPNASPLSFPSLLRNQGGAYASAFGAAGALPKSLALISCLPALKTLTPPSMDWLRSFFADLRPQQRHVGVDDRLQPWFREVKVQAARALIAEGAIPLCRSFAKFGVPHGCRAAIWEVALGIRPGPLTQAEVSEFESLVGEACAQPLLADLWAATDMGAVCDSEQFFLFEEILRAVSLAFMHDRSVPSHCSVEQHPLITVIPSPSQQEGQQPAAPYPPNGCLMPQGSVLLAAPLCFMFDSPHAVYRLHRAMYCRYWVKLQSLSLAGAPSPALPILLRTYEDMLLDLDPEVCIHLHRLGIPLAALAMPWICRAFVGYLPVEEVLLLWDRIVGMDSLLPVALLAVAIVCFRRQVLLSCGTSREVLEAMADLSQLRAVPLMQAVLFQA